MLRKYVTYAKQTCRPKLQNADYEKIAAVRGFAEKVYALMLPISTSVTEFHAQTSSRT